MFSPNAEVDWRGREAVMPEDGVTAVMLSRLPPRVTPGKLLNALDTIAPHKYDFVYLPQDKRKHRNVGLAFLNFTDCVSALAAIEFFCAQSLEEGLWGNVVVGRANIQGLGANLAYFLARCGLEALDNTNAPLVFENGMPLHIREAVAKYVTVAMVLEAQAKIKVEKASTKTEAPKAKAMSAHHRRPLQKRDQGYGTKVYGAQMDSLVSGMSPLLHEACSSTSTGLSPLLRGRSSSSGSSQRSVPSPDGGMYLQPYMVHQTATAPTEGYCPTAPPQWQFQGRGAPPMVNLRGVQLTDQESPPATGLRQGPSVSGSAKEEAELLSLVQNVNNRGTLIFCV